MKRTIVVVVVAGLLMVSSALFSEIIGTTDKQVRSIADPLLDNILEGFEKNDYPLYSRDFDDTLLDMVTDAKFQETDSWLENNLGKYQSRQYLGFLQKGKMTVILWKGRFDKSSDDILIRLVVSKRRGKDLVTGLWFQ